MKKVCFIGACGHVDHTYHLLKKCGDITFCGFAKGSTDEEDSSFPKGKMPVYDFYPAMLDVEKPDLAVVSPIFGLTGGCIIECARRGIDVFAEKPIAASVSQLKAVRDAVESSNVRLGAMHYLRYDPAFYTAISLVDQGAVGNIRMITAQKSYKYGSRPEWYNSEDLYVGIIPWVAIHAIDLIARITKKRFLTVTALHSTDKSALCQYELEDGIIASVNADFYRPLSAPTHEDDRVRIVGDRGVLEVKEGRVTLIDENGRVEIPSIAVPNPLKDFLDGRFSPDMEDIFHITGTALYSKMSAKERNKIRIE